MKETKHKPWPGQSREDFQHCEKCRWHGVLDGHICCDYSQVEGHGARMCKGGVGCEKYESTVARRRRNNLSIQKAGPELYVPPRPSNKIEKPKRR